MSDSRLPVPRQTDALTFDLRSPSPLIRRGVERLSQLAITQQPKVAQAFRPTLQWSLNSSAWDFTELGTGSSYPVVGDDTLFFTVWEDVTYGDRDPTTEAMGTKAFDTRTGIEIWFEPWVVFAVHGTMLFATHGDEPGFVMHDAGSRTERWRYHDHLTYKASPTYETFFTVSDRLICGMFQTLAGYSSEGKENTRRLVGIDPQTGIELWSCELLDRHHGGHDLDQTTGTLFALSFSLEDLPGDQKWAAKDCRIYALDDQTGEHLWSVPLEDSGDYMPWLKAFNGGVLVSQGEDAVMALEARTGQKRWAFRSARTDAPELIGGIILCHDGRPKIEEFPDDPGTIFTLDVETGSELWRFVCNSSLSHLQCMAAEGIVFITEVVRDYDSRPVLHALEQATGRTLWTFTKQSISSLHVEAISAGIVYVSAAPNDYFDRGRTGAFGEQRVYALDARTGSVLWTIGTTGNSSLERIYETSGIIIMKLYPEQVLCACEPAHPIPFDESPPAASHWEIVKQLVQDDEVFAPKLVLISESVASGPLDVAENDVIEPVTLSMLRDDWRLIKEEVKRRDSNLGALIEAAWPCFVDSGRVVFTAVVEETRDRINSDEMCSLIEDVLQGLYQQQVTVIPVRRGSNRSV